MAVFLGHKKPVAGTLKASTGIERSDADVDVSHNNNNKSPSKKRSVLSAITKKNVKLKAELVKNSRLELAQTQLSGARVDGRAAGVCTESARSVAAPPDAATSSSSSSRRCFTLGARKDTLSGAPVAAFLAQEAQLFGAVSLPNLDNAPPPPSSAQGAPHAVAPALSAVDCTDEKLDAYRRRIHRLDSSHSAHLAGSNSSLSSCEDAHAQFVRSDRDVHAHYVVSDRDAHSQYVSSGKAHSFNVPESATTHYSIGSNFQRSFAYSSMHTTANRYDATGNSVQQPDSSNNTLLVVRDVKARSCESEMDVASASAASAPVSEGGTPPSERTCHAHALAKNLEPEFRQRLFTAPPAMMRPSRKAFRLKSGRRHNEADVSHVLANGKQ